MLLVVDGVALDGTSDTPSTGVDPGAGSTCPPGRAMYPSILLVARTVRRAQAQG